jgi:superfamily I DNA and RNA helicase
MSPLFEEMSSVSSKNYQLEFEVPTAEQLERMRNSHRERSRAGAEVVSRATRGLAIFLEAIDRGDMELLDLPPNLRTKLITRLQADDANGND